MNGRRGAAVVLAGTVLLPVGAWLVGRHAMTRTFDVADVPLLAASEPDPEHGRHLVEHVLACGACHGDDLGGAAMDGGVLVGTLWAPNLTAGHGGVGLDYGASDWARAIRLGVGRDGQGLLFMRTRRWSTISDRDLADVVAWLEDAPAVDREPGAERPGLGLPLVVALGEGVDAGSLEPDDVVPSDVPWGPTADYGRYLSRLAGCDDCHGADLRGGTPAWSDVPAPSLAPGDQLGWTGARFARAVVQGRSDDGRTLHPSMPWRAYAGLTDTELDALWLAVRGSPADDPTADPSDPRADGAAAAPDP